MTKYAYCRVSTDEQGASGISLEHQRRTALKMGDRYDDPWGTDRYPHDCTQPGFFVDVVSAYKTPFAKRAAGKVLLGLMDPGDTIIFSRLDRGFRSVADFCGFIKLAQKNDWNVVCDDPQIDLSTPLGRMTAKLYTLIAEWHSDFNGQRVREAMAAKKNSKLRNATAERKPDVVVSAESEYRPAKKLVLPADMPRTMPSGRVFVYIRCSHRTSAESGLGLRHQMTKCCAYADMLVETHPALDWAEVIYTDPAVSALSIGLAKRPQGSKLDKELKAGDVVICLRPDRMFGSVADMSSTLVDWKKRGISLHFADGGVSMDTPSGQMVLNVMVSFSQFERQLAGCRAKETRAVLESQGKFTGGRLGLYPPFYRAHLVVDPETCEKVRRLVIDHKQMVAFRYLLIMAGRIGAPKALIRLEEIIAKREGNRRPIPQSGVKRAGPWKHLPEHYIANRDGHVFPIWTKIKFQRGKALWADIQKAWAEKRAEDREALRVLADQTGFRRHLAPARNHSQRHWDNKPDPMATIATGS